MLLITAAQAPTSAPRTPALLEHSHPPPPTQPQVLRGKPARIAGKDLRRDFQPSCHSSAFPRLTAWSWQAQSWFPFHAYVPQAQRLSIGSLFTHPLLFFRGCPAQFIIFFPKLVLLFKSTWEEGFRLSTETGFFHHPCFPRTVIQTTLIVHYFLSELPLRIIYLLLA